MEYTDVLYRNKILHYKTFATHYVKEVFGLFPASAVLYPRADCLSYMKENIPGYMGHFFVPAELSWDRMAEGK